MDSTFRSRFLSKHLSEFCLSVSVTCHIYLSILILPPQYISKRRDCIVTQSTILICLLYFLCLQPIVSTLCRGENKDSLIQYTILHVMNFQRDYEQDFHIVYPIIFDHALSWVQNNVCEQSYLTLFANDVSELMTNFQCLEQNLFSETFSLSNI